MERAGVYRDSVLMFLRAYNYDLINCMEYGMATDTTSRNEMCTVTWIS